VPFSCERTFGFVALPGASAGNRISTDNAQQATQRNSNEGTHRVLLDGLCRRSPRAPPPCSPRSRSRFAPALGPPFLRIAPSQKAPTSPPFRLHKRTVVQHQRRARPLRVAFGARVLSRSRRLVALRAACRCGLPASAAAEGSPARRCCDGHFRLLPSHRRRRRERAQGARALVPPHRSHVRADDARTGGLAVAAAPSRAGVRVSLLLVRLALLPSLLLL